MTDEARGFRSSRDAEVCVCGQARAEHNGRGKFKGMTTGRAAFCLAFRTCEPTIPNIAHFREVCENPRKFGGLVRDWDGRSG